MRGKTLGNLLDQLRTEAKISRTPAHNVAGRDEQIQMLQRKQEFFWEDFNWPHLEVVRNIALAEGQRYYSPPSDVDIGRILAVSVRNGSQWLPVDPGIQDGHYAAFDSDLDQRGDPAQRWQLTESGIEIWPIPDTDYNSTTLEGRLRIRAIRNLSPFTAEEDTADLDDRLIVLHCAAEILAGKGDKSAQSKADMAEATYARLRAGLLPRNSIRMFGGRTDVRRPGSPPIAIYRA